MIRATRILTRIARAATLLWLGLAVGLAITGRWWQAAAAASIAGTVDVCTHHFQRRMRRLHAIADRLDQLRHDEPPLTPSERAAFDEILAHYDDRSTA